MQLSMYEILSKANLMKNDEDRSEYLLSQTTQPMLTVLQFAFDKNVKVKLPENVPAPYRPTNAVEVHGRLFNEARRLYIFCEGSGLNLTDQKIQALWVELLESVHPDDAILLEHAKDKNLSKLFPNITEKLIRNIYPNLITSEYVEEVKKPVKGKKDEQN
jgi:hypothetical protein